MEELGSDAYVYGELVGADKSAHKLGSGEDSSQMIVRVPPRTAPANGEVIYVRHPPRPGAPVLLLPRVSVCRPECLADLATTLRYH